MDGHMQIDSILWILLPVFIAAGSSLLAYYVTQSRMDVALARERETLSEARAEARTWKNTLEQRVKAAEEETRRKALDEFMNEFRVEERHYFRDSYAGNTKSRCMVMQERLYFRNLPLSNWVEHEMMLEGNGTGSAEHLAKNVSVFCTKVLGEQINAPHLLENSKQMAIPELAEAFERAS